MSVYLAWRNAFQHRRRAWTAIAGISFSILLMFMQLGFATTARRAHTLLYELLDFDLMMTSDRFESLKNPLTFPAARLYQARMADGVADVARLNVDWAAWMDPATGRESSCMLVGVDLNPAFIRDERLKARLDAIRVNNALLVDELSHPAYGPLSRGRVVRINGTNASIAGRFRMGTDFKADGRAIVSQATYYGLQQKEMGEIHLGMIKVGPGVDPELVRAALAASMPPDVLVFDRATLIADEQDYYTEVKPIGLFFQAGMILAFCVGGVILFQVLATDIATRFREFATIKAIGMRGRFIYEAGVYQGILYGLLGYVPAFAVAAALFYGIHAVTRLPIAMSLRLAGSVLALSLLMCAVSSMLALIKVRRADPAALF
jgi:putative ABC transport system permease protein